MEHFPHLHPPEPPEEHPQPEPHPQQELPGGPLPPLGGGAGQTRLWDFSVELLDEELWLDAEDGDEADDRELALDFELDEDDSELALDCENPWLDDEDSELALDAEKPWLDEELIDWDSLGTATPSHWPASTPEFHGG